MMTNGIGAMKSTRLKEKHHIQHFPAFFQLSAEKFWVVGVSARRIRRWMEETKMTTGIGTMKSSREKEKCRNQHFPAFFQLSAEKFWVVGVYGERNFVTLERIAR